MGHQRSRMEQRPLRGKDRPPTLPSNQHTNFPGERSLPTSGFFFFFVSNSPGQIQSGAATWVRFSVRRNFQKVSGHFYLLTSNRRSEKVGLLEVRGERMMSAFD